MEQTAGLITLMWFISLPPEEEQVKYTQLQASSGGVNVNPLRLVEELSDVNIHILTL